MWEAIKSFLVSGPFPGWGGIICLVFLAGILGWANIYWVHRKERNRDE
jgi:hypothetical protein